MNTSAISVLMLWITLIWSAGTLNEKPSRVNSPVSGMTTVLDESLSSREVESASWSGIVSEIAAPRKQRGKGIIRYGEKSKTKLETYLLKGCRRCNSTSLHIPSILQISIIVLWFYRKTITETFCRGWCVFSASRAFTNITEFTTRGSLLHHCL